MYQFSFSRRRLFGLLVAVGVLHVLTFAVGLVIGLGVWAPTQKEIAMLNEHRSPRTAGTSPATPGPPTAAASPAPASNAAAAPAPANVPTANALVAPVEERLDAHSAAAGRFSLQVGSFTDAKNAKQLETELKERGYLVRVFKAIDPEQKMWHVVRIGAYNDVTAASRAAADFTHREQLQALVMRADSL